MCRFARDVRGTVSRNGKNLARNLDFRQDIQKSSPVTAHDEGCQVRLSCLSSVNPGESEVVHPKEKHESFRPARRLLLQCHSKTKS